MPETTLFRDVEVDAVVTDVLVADGLIAQVAPRLDPPPAAEVIDGNGGALLPGLHDHHLHLASLAAAMDSIDVGPPAVVDPQRFADTLRRAHQQLPAGAWIRATGYHESVAGPLDRHRLDRIVADRPVRVQDRSGKRWTLNSAALERVDAAAATEPGVRRDTGGTPTGIVERADDWLRRATAATAPDLAAVGARLAACGITGVTDCTPSPDADGPAMLSEAVTRGELPQHVVVTGGGTLVGSDFPARVTVGPVKLVLDEDALPDLDAFAESIRLAHSARRSVAVHVVTATSLAFALAAWDLAGTRSGDRIEHGSVITPAAVERIAELRLAVVTQPAFIAERGDRYLVDVDEADVAHLYRCASLIAAGVTVAAGSDAPYTDPDPWAAITAAVQRRTRSGVVVGPEERLPLDAALGLYLRDPLDLTRRRRVEPGAPADLCLLDRPLHRSRSVPTADDVVATYRAGVRI